MASNKALHRTAIPLRSIAAGELCRYAIFPSKGMKLQAPAVYPGNDDLSFDIGP